MVDIAVKSGAAWVCQSPERRLADVLLPVNMSGAGDGEEELSQSEKRKTNWGDPVLLQQTEGGSPCVLALRCSPASPATISHLLLISQARTMEVYSQTGEYCGTVRGERDASVQPDDGADGPPFYRKRLTLQDRPSSCDVKLLSLAGRSSVLVCRVIVGLQPLPPPPPPSSLCATAINMQQVQSLVEEMGASLSPGAQNLMDMVHFQQQNQTASLGGVLPLLMGGGLFSALSGGGNGTEPRPAAAAVTATATTQSGAVTPAQEVAPAENGAPSEGSTSPTETPLWSLGAGADGGESRRPLGHAQLLQVMSHLLRGREHGEAFSPAPELLPVLQSVCGQVAQLRLDDAAAAAEREKALRNGSWQLDAAMERRLEEMEKRLKEHVDRRLDALEQKLEKALLSVLPPLVAVTAGGAAAAAAGAAEQTAQTPAMH